MITTNGIKLIYSNGKLEEKVITNNYTYNVYNLSALKNIYIQDTRQKIKKKSVITGAVIGGIIDSSIGDDSIGDGMLLGALIGGTSTRVVGNLYATLHFFDNTILNVMLDDHELIVLQGHAIKNSNNKDYKTLAAFETIEIDKELFDSTKRESKISALTFITLSIILIVFGNDLYSMLVNSLEGPNKYRIPSFYIPFMGLVLFFISLNQFINAGGTAKAMKVETK